MSDRRWRLVMAGAVTFVVAAVIAIVALSGGDSTGGSGGGAPATTDSAVSAPALPGAQTGPPPWTNGGTGLADRLRAIGLPALPEEGVALHIHQHLDLFANGRRVRVPAGIGIDPRLQFISPLHTHDTTGVLHVESPTATAFTLGQFFEVWGVPLGAEQLGGLRVGDGRVLRAWVDGRPIRGNPAAITLAAHQEIVIAYGTEAQMPERPASSFDFGPGE